MTSRFLVLAIATCAASQALGAAADEASRFALSGHYQLRVNDNLVKDARLYLPPTGVPRLLIVAPVLPQAYLVTAGEKSVVPVDLARVRDAADAPDEVAVAPDSAPPTAGVLTVDGTRLRFTAGTARAVIEPRDNLLGDASTEELLAYMPEYRRHAAAYEPRRGDLRLLATIREPAEVEVFFGTWCPHCEKLIPRLIRVVQDVKNPNITLRFHGLPPRIDEDPIARQLKIEGVPTGLVRRGEELLGRMTGQSLERPEQSLSALLLFGGEGGSGSSAAAHP